MESFVISTPILGKSIQYLCRNSKIINPKLKKPTANSPKKVFCKENAKVLQRMQSVSYILSITYDTFYIFAFLYFDISSSKCCVARHSSSKLDSALASLHFDVPSSKCCVARHSSSTVVSALASLHFAK